MDWGGGLGYMDWGAGLGYMDWGAGRTGVGLGYMTGVRGAQTISPPMGIREANPPAVLVDRLDLGKVEVRWGRGVRRGGGGGVRRGWGWGVRRGWGGA